MAELYTVNYTINVKSQQAINALNSFQTATSKLTQAGNKLKAFERQINKTVAQFNKLSKKTPLLDFSTSKANQKLDVIIRKLEKINRLAKQNRTITVNTNPVTKTTGGAAGGTVVTRAASSRGTRQNTTARPRTTRGNYSYKVLGPAMIDTGGIGAIDMLKGMGIAYGIAGLGSLMSSAVKDATEYNNLMQTTRNILKTHDPDQATFDARFKAMEQMARYVGISTKFTAPEVADMTKFLAMAGLDINAINHAMNPVANVALIGDTDLGKTADLVTNIMTGYNISPENIGKATDVMTMTFTSANTTLTEIAEAYKYSASLLSAADVSFEESTAALGVLGNAGIKGSQGGTTLRTILANILNPRSKKRADAWEATGVKRFNEDGSLRSLVDIFADLSKLDLDPTAYYKMFDRTAAQGAVSLAAHVDTWNEIIRRNFMSEGIAQQLADEKKNTIQGLWYQLTSTFTEQGLRVFEDNDSPIRQFLIDTRKWIGSEDFKDTLQSMASLLFTILDTVKNLTVKLMKFYKTFGPVVELWLQAQLYLSALLIPLRIFKALINFGELIFSAARSVGTLAMQFGNLFKVLGNGTARRAQWQSMWSSILPPQGSGTASGAVVPIRSNRYALGVGLGAMGGSMLGGYLGSQIGEPGSTANMAGILGGTVLGGVAGSFVPKLITGLGAIAGISGMAAAGILGIVAALGVGVYKWYGYRTEMNKVVEANQQFIESTATINGINYSESATMLDKYLSFVYDKQMDVNQALGEYLRLRKKEQELNQGLVSDIQPYITRYQKQYDTFKAPYDGFWWDSEVLMNDIMAPSYLPDGSIDKDMQVTLVGDAFPSGKLYSFGKKLYRISGEKSQYEHLAVDKMLFAMGRDTSQGSGLNQEIQDFNYRLFSVKSFEDYQAIMTDLDNRINAIKAGMSYKEWLYSDIKDKSLEQLLTSRVFAEPYIAGLKAAFVGDTNNALVANTWGNIVKDFTTNKSVSSGDLYKFLLHRGVLAFDESNFGTFGSENFLANFGYKNGNWGVHTVKYKDDVTGEMVTKTYTAEEAQANFLNVLTHIQEVLKPIAPELQAAFDPIVNHPIWELGKKIDATKPKTLKGVDYYFKDGFWWPSENEDVLPKLSNAEMLQKLALENPNEDKNGDYTPSQSQYSQDYKSSTATPKQVIVRIENLMNVESIDMSNPENVAVIGNLKSQLAQALIDVVHDFDATYQ